jgi:hypothetical protein
LSKHINEYINEICKNDASYKKRSNNLYNNRYIYNDKRKNKPILDNNTNRQILDNSNVNT